MHFGGRLTPEEFWARFDAGENEIRADADRLLWYGIANWPGPLGVEWERRDGELTTIALVHDGQAPRLTVLSSTDDQGRARGED